MLYVLGRVAELRSEHVTVHPEIAGLLLRERIEVLAGAERVAQSSEVGSAEVVALTTASVERERVAAVGGVNRLQAPRDLLERGLP
jgi:hypothetical protein